MTVLTEFYTRKIEKLEEGWYETYEELAEAQEDNERLRGLNMALSDKNGAQKQEIVELHKIVDFVNGQIDDRDLSIARLKDELAYRNDQVGKWDRDIAAGRR